MIKINVISKNKNWADYLKNPKKYFNLKAKKLEKKSLLKIDSDLQFTILLAGNKEIQYLNKTFRKKNKTTDVLSFPFYNKVELKKLLKKREKLYLGDIIINFYKIKKKNKIIFVKQLDKLWAHGLAHLLGYTHTKNSDYYRMQKIEKLILNS
tara:strand:+ start:48 stop:503 length:456 start_codon:yes stop_codon:yes gene_type:complete